MRALACRGPELMLYVPEDDNNASTLLKKWALPHSSLWVWLQRSLKTRRGSCPGWCGLNRVSCGNLCFRRVATLLSVLFVFVRCCLLGFPAALGLCC